MMDLAFWNDMMGYPGVGCRWGVTVVGEGDVR
jgi:hypothetical protein